MPIYHFTSNILFPPAEVIQPINLYIPARRPIVAAWLVACVDTLRPDDLKPLGLSIPLCGTQMIEVLSNADANTQAHAYTLGRLLPDLSGLEDLSDTDFNYLFDTWGKLAADPNHGLSINQFFEQVQGVAPDLFYGPTQYRHDSKKKFYNLNEFGRAVHTWFLFKRFEPMLESE